MIDHEDIRSVLDSISEKAFGPAWILLGMVEVASALTRGGEYRYQPGWEGFVHHLMDLTFPALTALAGVVSVYLRHRSKEKQLQLEREKMLLKHELEVLRLKLSAPPQPEADSEETVDLGPVS